MPIAVRCPSCSASFSVKDEYAGKRTKCPKCGGPLSIPTKDIADTVRMPYPTDVLKPSKPAASRPAGDEPDEKPQKKRVADEEEDNRPRSKKQSRVEDDRPKRRGGEESDQDELLPKRVFVPGRCGKAGKGVMRRVEHAAQPGLALVRAFF